MAGVLVFPSLGFQAQALYMLCPFGESYIQVEVLAQPGSYVKYYKIIIRFIMLMIEVSTPRGR